MAILGVSELSEALSARCMIASFSHSVGALLGWFAERGERDLEVLFRAGDSSSVLSSLLYIRQGESFPAPIWWTTLRTCSRRWTLRTSRTSWRVAACWGRTGVHALGRGAGEVNDEPCGMHGWKRRMAELLERILCPCGCVQHVRA